MGTHLKKTLNFFSCSSPRLSSVFSLHASFSRFEDDVWIEIAKYLDGRSMVMLATTCKWFYKTLSAECVWKYASLRDLAVPDPGDVSFSWKKLYASAFDGSHSCLFRQQEKHIDACCMIDRRMGIYGYPIEIQSLFFFALRCAKNMLKEVPDNKELLDKINSKIKALSYHIQTYYWFDYTQLNNIYRYKTEEYSHTALNKFNVSPESIPDWLFEFMPLRNGYFIGNVSPARMDFRWFLLGNCISILSSLATPKQASAILDLIEARWDELVGEMPLKISYPALEGYDRNIITGFDSKNTRWSYHNGGSWPVLLWLLVSACIKTARPQMVGNAIKLVEKHLSNDGWPEYYDGKTGRYIGKQARISQFEDDVWIEIAKYLDGRSLVMLATTCRWFYKTLSEECMWKYACLCDLAVPDPGDVSFNWKNLYASAFDGSHSYLFCQQEKHIDWIWIGAVFLESSAAIVTEKLTSPPRKISQKETLEQILQSRGLCVLTNIKTGIWIADLQLVRCSVCDLNTCDGTMQTLDARHFELFMNESDQDGSWDYTQISSHEAKKQVDGASGAILDLKHLKDASSTEIFKAKSWIGKQNDWQPKAKLTLHAVCGVESLALPCKFLADGSHSYLFHQQEKRIGSSVAIVTEKLTSPPWKIHLKETLVQMLQSRGLCVLTNIKFHAVMSSLESVGSTDYRGDRDEGSGDDDGGGDDGGGGDDDDNGEEGQGESQGEEEGSINGPEGDKRDKVVDVYWRLNKDDENIIWITNLNFHHCCYSLGGKKALFDHVRLKVAEVRHQAVTKDYKIVLETRTDKNREFSEMFTKYHEISRNLHRVIICPDPEITPPILLTC